MAPNSEGWINRFPDLDQLEAEERAFLLERAHVVSLPPNRTIFAPGHPATQFLLVLDGTVRVRQISPQGREIVLYRVTAGESCILTTACLLGQDSYYAEGLTETEVQAVTVSKDAFDALMSRSAEFRRIVFADYSSRITDLLHLVEEVAFERIDKRLAQRVLDRGDAQGKLYITHQDLATELGSAREVVSRHLKEFQRRGLLDITRGSITLLDRRALERIAAE